MLRTRPWVPYLYVAPAVALLCLVFAYPVVRVVDFSTRLIRGASGPYVGSLNYQLVWEDPTFRDALKQILTAAFPGIAIDEAGTIDAVTAAHRVDMREGRKIGRPVAGDVDELTLPRHERLQFATGAVHE